jgi:hypothetical protein
LYATVLTLIGGSTAVVRVNAALFVTFGCWLIALLLTLMALTPNKWVVNTTLLKQDPEKLDAGLGIEDFFEQAAGYKRRRLIAASVLFFVGVISAVFTRG